MRASRFEFFSETTIGDQKMGGPRSSLEGSVLPKCGIPLYGPGRCSERRGHPSLWRTLCGGRNSAVYLSSTDSGASKEVTARKARLGGTAQINTSKYPRVVYAVAVNLDRALDLADWSSSDPGKTIASACLSIDDLTTSMAFAHILEAEGIQGLVFPSVVAGGDDNLIVYLSNCSAGSLTLQNEQEIIGQAKRIARKHK